MASCTSRSKTRKHVEEKNRGVTGAIVPAKKPVDMFPLMTYVAKTCSFSEDEESNSLLDEEALKADNDRRTEELLHHAAQAVKPHQSTDSSDDERKKALEVIHSLEFARNQEDTWKISKPASKKEPNYGGFLHPLKRYDKEDEYFSGTRKVKQPRERKRSRSDEVVLLEEGKLISKHGEPSQLPIKFTHPSNSSRPRVPSIGLPFTPAPPPPAENSVWYQKGGAELFSEVHSLLPYGVSCNEDEAVALAIAESLRTAKQEEQRSLDLLEMYKNQCASSTSAPKPRNNMTYHRLPPPDPPGTNWDDDDYAVPPALCALSKDTKGTGASKKKEITGNRSGFTLNDQASADVKMSRNHENNVPEASSTFVDESLQQRSRYDNERNVKSRKSSLSESPVSHLSDKKALEVEFQCENVSKKALQREVPKKSSEMEMIKSCYVDQKKPNLSLEHHEKLLSTATDRDLQDSLQAEQKHSFSAPVSHDCSIAEPKSEVNLTFKSASNETSLKELPIKVGSPHKIEPESSFKDLSKNNPMRCKYGGFETHEDDDSDGCERPARQSRSLANTISSSRQTEAAGEMMKPSSARLPTSKSALMSAMKTYMTTEANITGTDSHPSDTSQHAFNQKQYAVQDGKSENVSANNQSPSQCIKTVDRNMNEIKVQEVHTASMASDSLNDKKGLDLPMGLDQNLIQIQNLLMQQALEGKPSVLQDGQNGNGVTRNAKLNLNQGIPQTQASAANQYNSFHSALAGLPRPFLDTVLPPYMFGVGNASANDFLGLANNFSASPQKALTSQAQLSLPQFSVSQASTGPPILTNSQATAGFLDLLPSAHHRLPGFHAAGLSGTPMGPSIGQPDSTKPFTPLHGGVLGVPSLLPAQLPGIPGPLLGAFSGLQNGLPGMPGLTTTMSGMPNMAGGLPQSFCPGLSGLPSPFASSTPGFQKSLDMPVTIQGLNGQVPSGTPGSVEPFFASMQNLPGCLPFFGDISNARGAAPSSSYSSGLGLGGSPPQPGSAPLVTGKGRGRLARGLNV